MGGRTSTCSAVESWLRRPSDRKEPDNRHRARCPSSCRSLPALLTVGTRAWVPVSGPHNLRESQHSHGINTPSADYRLAHFTSSSFGSVVLARRSPRSPTPVIARFMSNRFAMVSMEWGSPSSTTSKQILSTARSAISTNSTKGKSRCPRCSRSQRSRACRRREKTASFSAAISRGSMFGSGDRLNSRP